MFKTIKKHLDVGKFELVDVPMVGEGLGESNEVQKLQKDLNM